MLKGSALGIKGRSCPPGLRASRSLRSDRIQRLQQLAKASASDPNGSSYNPTISSLDKLLGSRDEDDGAKDTLPLSEDAVWAQAVSSRELYTLPVQSLAEETRETLVQEARAKPQISTAMYYITLLVYTSYFGMDLLEGPGAAEDLMGTVVNDHAAVASGDLLRLFTSGFVTFSIPQLISTLFAQVTIGAEMEGIMGPPAFWAIYSLSTITGSLADAAFSPWPVTHGPQAGLAGIVGALIAHGVHNWRLETVAAPAATTGSITQRQQGQAGQQQQQPERFQQGQQQQQAVQGSLEEDLQLTPIEIADGISFNMLLPKEGRLWVDLVGLLAACFTILESVYRTREDASWEGLAAGLVAGLWLGWGLGPRYNAVVLEEVVQEGSAGNPYGLLRTQKLRLVDQNTGVARFNVSLGCASMVFAAMGVWLWYESPFVP